MKVTQFDGITLILSPKFMYNFSLLQCVLCATCCEKAIWKVSEWFIDYFKGANTERKSRHQWWGKRPNKHCSKICCNRKVIPRLWLWNLNKLHITIISGLSMNGMRSHLHASTHYHHTCKTLYDELITCQHFSVLSYPFGNNSFATSY